MKVQGWLVLALLTAVVWVQAAHPISNPDFGWHVAVGRWILEHGSTPDAEPLTHTARGVPMIAHSWLSQLGYAATIDAVGVVGLRWANAGLAALCVCFLFAWFRRAGVGSGFALLACVAWAFLAQDRFQLRPYMWNTLLFVIAYGGLFVVRPRLGWAQLAGLFALMVLWINLHSGAVLLPAIAVGYAGVATFERFALGRLPSREQLGEGRLVRLWLLAGLLGLAVVVSPNHVQIFGYAIESGRVNANLSLEWASIASERGLWSRSVVWILLFFGITLAAGAVAVIRRRQVPLAELAVVLFVTALPFASQRFGWMCFVPLLFVLSQWVLPRRLDAAAAVAAAALIVVIGLRLNAGVIGPSSNFRPAVFPVGAMTFLEGVGLEGHLFNSNKWGGYVLFRTQERYPVFVDGRWITIGERIVRDSHAIANRTPGYEQLLDDYEIEILLVHRGWMTDAVREAGSWIPLFENFNSGVYVRPGEHLGRNLRRCKRYYERRQIPFDMTTGFAEQSAALANPSWAHKLRVQRRHLDQFGHHGRRGIAGSPRWVEGW